MTLLKSILNFIENLIQFIKNKFINLFKKQTISDSTTNNTTDPLFNISSLWFTPYGIKDESIAKSILSSFNLSVNTKDVLAGKRVKIMQGKIENIWKVEASLRDGGAVIYDVKNGAVYSYGLEITQTTND